MAEVDPYGSPTPVNLREITTRARTAFELYEALKSSGFEDGQAFMLLVPMLQTFFPIKLPQPPDRD